MNYTIIALSGYIVWTMILLLGLATYRSAFNKLNNRTSLKFDANGSDVGSFGQRLTRAYANCYESFTFIGGTMLLALASDSGHITNTFALIVLVARIVQSSIHIVSVSNAAIIFRFVFFLVQFGICAYWLLLILQKFV
ncbi:MAG: MAPEG family protein [Glaciecola sp.]